MKATVNKFISNLSMLVAAVSALTLMGFIFYINRFGFDLSDESFYGIGYIFKIPPTVTTTQFHLIINRTLGFLDLSILQIRDLRTILHISSSVLLACGIIDYVKRFEEIDILERLTLISLVCIGSLLSYDFSPLTLSYNSLSGILLNALVGCWLFSLNIENQKHKHLLNLAVGFTIGLIFYAKFTNALLLIVILPIADAIYLIVSNVKNFTSSLLTRLLAYLMGFFLSILIYTNYNLGIIESLTQFFEVVSYADEDYSLAILLEGYIENLSVLNENTWKTYVPLVLISLTLKSLQSKISRNIIDILFSISVVGFSMYFAFENESYIGGLYKKYSIFEIYYILYIASLAYWLCFGKISVKNLCLLVLFFGIPFIGSAGTNNGLTATFLFYLSFVLASIHLFLINAKPISRLCIYAGLGILSIVQVYYATVEYTYRQAPIEFEKMSNLDLSEGLSGINLHKELAVLKSDLSFLEHLDIENLFLFSTESGISLILNIRPMPYGWIRPGEEDYACYVVSSANFSEPEKIAFIIPNTAEIGSKLSDCFLNKGIDFHNDYKLVKSVSYYNHAYDKAQLLEVYIHKKSRTFLNGISN